MKIFLELWTGIGPLIRSLPIAQELRSRGHQIEFLAHDQSVQYMLACGFSRAGINPHDIAVRPTSMGNWRSIDTISTLRGFADSDWRRYLTQLQPDLVISDFGIQSAIAARSLNIPLATITQSCMHPGRKGKRIYYWDSEANEDWSNNTADTINHLLTSFNAEPITRIDDLYLGQKTLIPSFPEFDWLEEEHKDSTCFCGPILWSGTEKAIPPLNLTFPNNNPKIFMYTGRMHDSAGNSGEMLLKTAIESAISNPALNMIISTGGMDAHASDFENKLPQNVKIVDWLPVEQAYSQCDIIIHHGGHGSCMANFKYGRPALIIPTHTERKFNAHRMQDLQAGLILQKEDLSSQSLLEGIQQLLENCKYMDVIKTYKHMIQTHYINSVRTAANYIEA